MFAVLVTQPAQGDTTIRLVSARNRIAGSMLGNQAVYADEARIYLASFQGKLFVLVRSRAANFPLLQVVQDTIFPLTAVRGDATFLYVTSVDGALRVYRKGHLLALVATVPLSRFGLNSLALRGKNLYVAKGQAQLAVDANCLYLSALNEGDTALEMAKETLTLGPTYGQTFEPYTAMVFARRNGRRVSSVPFPPNVWGQPAQAGLYVDSEILAQTVAGCCGSGIFLYDPTTLQLDQVIPRFFTNTVVRRNRWLIAGNEGGQVEVFDLHRHPSPLIASADLRRLTGHTGSEDIEIRALWTDRKDNLIFAASSWGNRQSQAPSLPAFFVLELVTDNDDDDA